MIFFLFKFSEQGTTADRAPPRARFLRNVSKVLFLSGITQFDQEGVRYLLASVSNRGGKIFKMPQGRTEFVTALNTIDGGHVPAGTLVAGMNVTPRSRAISTSA